MVDHYDRAELLYQQRRYDLALRELQQVLAAEPNDAYAHALRGMCLGQQGQSAAGLEALSTAIGLAPDIARFHYLRGYLLWDHGQFQQAHTAVSEALRLDPTDVDFYAARSGILYDQSQYKPALYAAEEGLKRNPEHQGCLTKRLLALLFLESAEYIAAETQAVLANEPNNPTAHAVAGWVALHQRRIAAAGANFQDALRLNPNYEWARLGMVETLKLRNPFYQVIRFLERRRVGWLRLFIIPHLWIFLVLMLVLVTAGKVICTAILTLDPYGRLIMTPEEQQVNRWHLAGLGSVCAGIAFILLGQNGGWLVLLSSLWLGTYCLWRLKQRYTQWYYPVWIGFLFGLTLVIDAWSIAAIWDGFPTQEKLSDVTAFIFGMGLILLMVLLSEFGLLIIGLTIRSLVQVFRQNSASKTSSTPIPPKSLEK
jgi:Tfp pilus assembly protein PilF/lipoprotein signal peptidase